MKKIQHLMLVAAAAGCLSASAQMTFKGIYQNNRYDDHADHWYTEFVGYNSTWQKYIFIVENGIYDFTWDGTTLSTPVKNPAVNKEDFYQNGQFIDDDKALWANNFNLMSGNSGAVRQGNLLVTVHSRTGEDVDSTSRFAVRKWDVTTGDLLSGASDFYPEDAMLESAGMAVNPVDGKVYGLFHVTKAQLPDEILNDPDFFTDQDGDATATDAGYCIGTIDLETMAVTLITPGLYYGNFVTFAINKEGRAFALTSGGVAVVPDENGMVYDIDGNRTGAHLYEFDLATGLMIERNIEGTGFPSQARRQCACFSNTDPNIMYWNGYVNSGKGYNDYGVWANLSDKDWKTNGKYDTALYAVDITTGEATRLAKFTNRYTFCTMWVDGEDDPIVEPLRGDVDANGVVDIDDVNALGNIMLEYKTPDDYDGIADVNGDGNVDVDDMNIVINIILEK